MNKQIIIKKINKINDSTMSDIDKAEALLEEKYDFTMSRRNKAKIDEEKFWNYCQSTVAKKIS